MEKVICLKCKDIGFTASPKYVLCHCGGSLVVMSEELFDENPPKEKEKESHENFAHIKQ